jgi:GNAT superfamily N-acetyltransferase
MIRIATEDDIPSILLLCEEFWAYTIYDEAFNADHTRLMVDMALDHGLLAVLDAGTIVGFVAGIKSALLGSTQALTGTELAWWISPDHRKGRNGIKLMLFIEDLARKQGIKYWNMISMESSDPERANKIYEKLGYVKSETSYTKVF